MNLSFTNIPSPCRKKAPRSLDCSKPSSNDGRSRTLTTLFFAEETEISTPLLDGTSLRPDTEPDPDPVPHAVLGTMLTRSGPPVVWILSLLSSSPSLLRVRSIIGLGGGRLGDVESERRPRGKTSCGEDARRIGDDPNTWEGGGGGRGSDFFASDDSDEGTTSVASGGVRGGGDADCFDTRLCASPSTAAAAAGRRESGTTSGESLARGPEPSRSPLPPTRAILRISCSCSWPVFLPRLVTEDTLRRYKTPLPLDAVFCQVPTTPSPSPGATGGGADGIPHCARALLLEIGDKNTIVLLPKNGLKLRLVFALERSAVGGVDGALSSSSCVRGDA